jgi:hypothetical protein
MKLIHLAVGGLLIATASACSSPSPAADPRPAPAPASTTVPANPYAVPQVITVAYVNSVLKALNHVNGNAARELALSHQVNDQVKTDLRAIFNGPAFALQIEGAEQSIKQGIVDNVRPDGGDVRTVVVNLLTATRRCVFFQSASDTSALFQHPVPNPASSYVELIPKQIGVDPEQLNSTPWAFALEVGSLKPAAVPNPCTS